MKTKIIELLKSSKKKFLRKREISKILKINQKEYKTFRIVLKTLLNDGEESFSYFVYGNTFFLSVYLRLSE